MSHTLKCLIVQGVCSEEIQKTINWYFAFGGDLNYEKI